MYYQFLQLENLPLEISLYIAKMLEDANLAKLSTTSKYHCFLFSPPLTVRLQTKIIDYLNTNKLEEIDYLLKAHLELRGDNKFMVRLLMHYAECGHFLALERELLRQPKLLLERLDFTDKHGRIFKNITLFQYAWWSFNFYQSNFALYHFNKLDNGLTKAQGQLAELEATGINYFDMAPLIKMYLDYDNQINKEEAMENIQLAEEQLPITIKLLLQDNNYDVDNSLAGRFNLLQQCIKDRENAFQECKLFLANPLPTHKLYKVLIEQHPLAIQLPENPCLNSVAESQCNII